MSTIDLRSDAVIKPNQEQLMLNPNRHRLYREHKYVCFFFDTVLKQIACMDFNNTTDITSAKNELNNLKQLLEGHATHEEQQIHRLLKLKCSDLYQIAEAQHQEHPVFFDHIATKFNALEKANTLAEKDFLGYEIYLDIRKFYADNLKHFDYEERVIMPELQRLCSDAELKAIDHASYHEMSPKQIFHMVSILFPHMNREDRGVFLADIKDCVPDKFVLVWPQIASLIEP